MLAHGYRSCGLWVFPQNRRAIRFYCAAGFRETGAVRESLEIDGSLYPERKRPVWAG
jgi:RimJ/RimL family protein N-acetyltransferase